MISSLDKDQIAKDLGAVRVGQVSAHAGYFGAVQLIAEVAMLNTSIEGEARVVRLSAKANQQLEALAHAANMAPEQFAAKILEDAMISHG